MRRVSYFKGEQTTLIAVTVEHGQFWGQEDQRGENTKRDNLVKIDQEK